MLTGKNCFSEDTGLEVDALNGAPGVPSARYAGDGGNFQENIDKLLLNLAGRSDRSARFRTVICLILDEQQYLFEGECSGQNNHIATRLGRIWYDPVLYQTAAIRLFAEMGIDEKYLQSQEKSN